MPETPAPRHPIGAVVHPDPWPYYAALCERPLHFDATLGLWVAADAAAVQAALQHPGLRVRPPDEPVPRALAGTPVGEVFARLVRMNDGDFHRRERPVVDEALQRFTLSHVAEAAVQATGDLMARAPVDANALLGDLPVRAMARLFEMPPASIDDTVRAVQRFTRAIAPQAAQESIDQGNDAVRVLLALGRQQGLGEQASVHRLAFMQQSLDATAGLIGNAVLRLQSRAAPQDLGGQGWREWTAELARWDPPIHNTRRFAAADGDLAGHTLRAGQGVLLLVAAANRDPALNADPDVFDSQRLRRRSLGFGAGAHRCPGEAIAIEIAATALRRLHESGRMQDIFGPATGFRPLANARIPVFPVRHTQGATPWFP